MSLYVHIEEGTSDHGWVQQTPTPYGIRWRTITKDSAVKAFELRSRIADFPDDLDAVFEAIRFAREMFKAPITIPSNHYNVESVRDLMDDSKRVIKGEARLYSIESIMRQLELDDKSKQSDLGQACVSYQLTDRGFIDWIAQGTGGLIDMLCVISTLSKLLQK